MSHPSRAALPRTVRAEVFADHPPGPGAERDLIVADAAAPDIRDLMARASVRWIPLTPGVRPVAALACALAGEEVDTLHLVTHGRAGALVVAGQVVDVHALVADAHLLSGLKVRRIAL